MRPSEDYPDTPEEPAASAAPPARDPSKIAAFTGSTPLPQFFTTTVRPPRALPSGGLLSGRNLRTSEATFPPTPAPTHAQETQELQPFVK